MTDLEFIEELRLIKERQLSPEEALAAQLDLITKQHKEAVERR